MAANGHTNGRPMVVVMYKVANSGSDPGKGLYNAFQIPRGSGVTLATVKRHCTALRSLNHAGADGYHWRVRVDEKPPAAAQSSTTRPPPAFSWWDIQDENAKLPIKEATASELEHLFSPPKPQPPSASSADTATKAAKGAMNLLGKAVGGSVGGSTASTGSDQGPRVSVIAFKLLDLLKMHDEFELKHPGSKGEGQSAKRQPVEPRVSVPAPSPQPPRPRAPVPPPQVRATAPSRQQTAASNVPRVPAPGTQPKVATAAPVGGKPAGKPAGDMMQGLFGNESAGGAKLHHAMSSPPSFNNETRAERKKREYAEAKMKQKKVWDEVDQRWVVIDTNSGSGAVHKGSTAAPPGAVHSQASQKKVVGISIDAKNAVGKSANVQAAVNARVTELKESQQKALDEVREREKKKKQSEDEEDAVRRRLEPKIRAWSEEHGKKKQLRALLANLHTILWPEANWKQVSLGDILDPNKCKRCFHKASRVVHPDKTHHLSAENRFLAKRIFDALSQAKTEFDSQQ